MTYNWTDGPELSTLLVRANGLDYAAEIAPSHGEFHWDTYKDNHPKRWGSASDRDTAKREAEQAMTALIEKDFNEGDTE